MKIADLFAAIGFKVNDTEIKKLDNTLKRVNKSLRQMKRNANLNIRMPNRALRTTEGILNRINRGLTATRQRFNQATGAARKFAAASSRGGGGTRRGGIGIGGVAAGNIIANMTQTAMFGVAQAIGPASVVSTGQAIESMRAALLAATGSAEQANKEFTFLENLTDKLGINFESAVQPFTNFMAAGRIAGMGLDQTREVFEATTLASKALGLGVDDTRGTLRALTQMISKGKVSAEELRQQLGERLPIAVGLMAKALNVTEKELNGMLERGELISKDVLPKFGKEMRKWAMESGAVEEQMNSNVSAMNRLSNAWLKFRNQIFKSGFNKSVTELFEVMTKFLNKDTGLVKVFAGAYEILTRTIVALVKIVEVLVGWFGKLSQEMQVILVVAGVVFAAIASPLLAIIGFVTSLILIVEDLMVAMRNPAGSFLAKEAERGNKIAQILIGITELLTNILPDALEKGGIGIGNLIADVADWAKAIEDLFNRIVTWFQEIPDRIAEAVDRMIAEITRFWNDSKVKEFVDLVGFAFSGAQENIAGGVGTIQDFFDDSGRVLNNPNQVIAGAGTIDRSSQTTIGEQTININGAGDPDAVADAVVEKMNQEALAGQGGNL